MKKFPSCLAFFVLLVSFGFVAKAEEKVKDLQLNQEEKTEYLKSLRLPQVIVLREALDAYLSGKKSSSLDDFAAKDLGGDFKTGLEAFPKKYYSKKFCLLGQDNNKMGGVILHVIPQESPDLILDFWMVKLTDSEQWILRSVWENFVSRDDKEKFQSIKERARPCINNPEYGF
jgi:hypothetical protein